VAVNENAAPFYDGAALGWCIFEGNTTELALIVVEWFENAALGSHLLLIDTESVRTQITDDDGYDLRVFTYHRIKSTGNLQTCGEIRNERSDVSLLGDNRGRWTIRLRSRLRAHCLRRQERARCPDNQRSV